MQFRVLVSGQLDQLCGQLSQTVGVDVCVHFCLSPHIHCCFLLIAWIGKGGGAIQVMREAKAGTPFWPVADLGQNLAGENL